jgi:antitoxin HicB
MKDFHVVLTEDPIDGGYVATVPEIPEIITEGDTIEEAMEMAKDAIETYLSYQKETSKAIIKILPRSDLKTSSSS